MIYVMFGAEYIKGMYSFRFRRMRKLRPTISLNFLGGIAKKDNGTLDKIDRGEA